MIRWMCLWFLGKRDCIGKHEETKERIDRMNGWNENGRKEHRYPSLKPNTIKEEWLLYARPEQNYRDFLREAGYDLD